MIRLLIERLDYGGAAHGADLPAMKTHQTIEVTDERVVAALTQHRRYEHVSIVGFEVVESSDAE